MQHIHSLCYVCEHNSLQQHSPTAKEDFMYTFRCILRTNRLAFISYKPNTVICEYFRCFLCHCRFTGDQDALLSISFAYFV